MGDVVALVARLPLVEDDPREIVGRQRGVGPTRARGPKASLPSAMGRCCVEKKIGRPLTREKNIAVFFGGG